MNAVSDAERIETVVVGGGQAGLSVGYHLARRSLSFVILDAHERIGDSWRMRWDSLRLFTPARFNGLDGLPFPGSAHSFSTKDEVADYLETYAARFRLPVRTGVRVRRLSRNGARFLVDAGPQLLEADNVVVAVGSYQLPRLPRFAASLDPDIVQLHSGAYRNVGQLREGRVLVVGVGNSGAEIALDLAASLPTWLAGTESGRVPFRHEKCVGAAHLPAVDVPCHRPPDPDRSNTGRTQDAPEAALTCSSLRARHAGPPGRCRHPTRQQGGRHLRRIAGP
jgi:putative flavoprotein involved in K+ transport